MYLTSKHQWGITAAHPMESAMSLALLSCDFEWVVLHPSQPKHPAGLACPGCTHMQGRKAPYLHAGGRR
jgi:hypothetical protein